MVKVVVGQMLTDCNEFCDYIEIYKNDKIVYVESKGICNLLAVIWNHKVEKEIKSIDEIDELLKDENVKYIISRLGLTSDQLKSIIQKLLTT